MSACFGACGPSSTTGPSPATFSGNVAQATAPQQYTGTEAAEPPKADSSCPNTEISAELAALAFVYDDAKTRKAAKTKLDALAPHSEELAEIFKRSAGKESWEIDNRLQKLQPNHRLPYAKAFFTYADVGLGTLLQDEDFGSEALPQFVQETKDGTQLCLTEFTLKDGTTIFVPMEQVPDGILNGLPALQKLRPIASLYVGGSKLSTLLQS